MTNVAMAAKATVARDRDELDAELGEVALDRAARATDGRDREDARGHGAEHAADAVDGEDIERIVDVHALAQQRRGVAQRRPRRRR